MKKNLSVFRDTIICGILIIVGLILPDTISMWLYMIAIGIGGYEQTKEGITDLVSNKNFSVELLMIFSAICACIIGEYKEGAILIFIFSLSGALETMTMDRSQKDINQLMNNQPQFAQKIMDTGTLEQVKVEELLIGDRILVAAGESIPCDGRILNGESSIEEAAITGESMPKYKRNDDLVYGGTINLSNPLTIEVSTDPEDILIKKIIRMVEEAKTHESNTSKYINKLENNYALFVLILVSLVVLIPWLIFKVPFNDAFYKGMVLLVVASPCALIAAVTPATLSAISNGTKKGILVKGGEYFESLEETKAMAFDKTGTLTKNIPVVKEVYFIDDVDNHIPFIVDMERHSNHPLGNAIVTYFEKDGNTTLLNGTINEMAGQGIKGIYNGIVYKLGKLEFMSNTDKSIIEKGIMMSKKGQSLVYVSVDDRTIGVIGIADEIREDAKALIEALNNRGIETIMVTGDVEDTAQAIANELGITRVIAQLLPQEKVEIVEKLQQEYGTVVMVGDGINDAPALANASVGIALSGGTDIAIESSDIILVRNNLLNINYALDLSKKLKKIIIENIIFSVSIIIILVILNFLNMMNLPLGVVFHEGSTILVILNGLRLLKIIK